MDSVKDIMKKDRRILITLPDGLRRVVRQSAEHRGCSQAEVVRASIYNHLRDFVEKDDKVKIVKPKKEELFEIELNDKEEKFIEEYRKEKAKKTEDKELELEIEDINLED